MVRLNMKPYGLCLPILIWLLFAVMPVSADAVEPVRLEQSLIALDDGQLSILEDPNRQLDWQQALAAQHTGRFKHISYGVGEGYSNSAFWVYTRIERTEHAPENWSFISSPIYLDHVDYYLVQNGQLHERLSAGDLSVDREHDIHHRLPIVGATLPDGPIELLIKLDTSSTSVLLVQMVPTDKVAGVIEGRILSEGILIGILLVVLVINLINGIWLRRPLFFYFVAYETSMLVTILLSNGYTRDLFPGLSATEQNLYMQYGVLTSGFLAFVFFQRMLNFSFRGRRWVNVLFAVGVAHSWVGLYFATRDLYPEVMQFVNTYVTLFPIIVSAPLVASWRSFTSEQKFRAGGFFVFGVFVVVNCLYTIGYTPVTIGTTYIAPVMILSFQLSLHFILMFSVRTSESSLQDARRRAELFNREMAVERSQRQSHEMFMAMFSHEVRTPLAVIDTSVQSLQLLEHKEATPAARQQRHKRIREAVVRINQLLQMSLLRGRDALLNADGAEQQHDIQQLLSETIAEFPLTQQRRIQHPVSMGRDRFRTHLPASILGVLMRNLIDNALKYSPADRPVEVSVELNAGSWIFSVRDYGDGMNEYVRRHMFERHFRANERDSIPGLGLGLFVVKEIIDKCAGNIEVDSGDKGTRIMIQLQGASKWLSHNV